MSDICVILALMEILKCENIKVNYDNQTVIDDLSFSVNYGDYLCIVGDNGAGKSTLVKCLLSLKSISGGSLIFDSNLKKNQIGYVSQNSDISDDFPATVSEIVLSGCLNQDHSLPFYSKKAKSRADEVLHSLSMCSLRDKKFSELSGGQKKRVLLARALMASEKLLILDEPVAALDPIATEEFYDTMDELNKSGMTLIMVSHDIHTAVHRASSILHLSAKMPNFYGTTDEYLASDIGHAYLGDHGNCSQCHTPIHHK